MLHPNLENWLAYRRTHRCHRQLLVISGSRLWAENTLQHVVDTQPACSKLYCGHAKMGSDSINVKDYRQKLGQEYDWVILNSFDGFRANAAIALSGTVKAKGLMVLLCPNLEDWQTYPDPEITNRVSYGFSTKNNGQFFNYLRECLVKDPSIFILEETTSKIPSAINEITTATSNFSEQALAIDKIKSTVQNKKRMHLLLCADRGRGKSAALGIAAGQLMQQQSINIVITAPTIHTVKNVFQHAQALLSKPQEKNGSLKFGNGSLVFQPIDKLIEDKIKGKILFVDEAASIPIYGLNQLTSQFDRIIFSTTLHGYEGSGRGFEMRFKKALQANNQGCNRVNLQQPIRWSSGDNLERFWFDTLFYQNQKSSKFLELQLEQIEFLEISKTNVLEDSQTTTQIVQLLTDAHYQTSPDDIQRLYDAPELMCFVLKQNDKILAVAQVAREGGELLIPISKEVCACNRRVKGHLVAQNIGATYNSKPFVESEQWRISRIAVANEYQRKHLGTVLINHLIAQTKKQGIPLLTAAFGLTPTLASFWSSNGFIPLKISNKLEIASGEHNSIYALPITDRAKHLLEPICAQFNQEWFYQIDKDLKYLSPILAMQITALTFKSSASSNPTYDPSIINQFCRGNRHLSTCKRGVRDFFIDALQYIDETLYAQKSVLALSLLQNRSDKTIIRILKLTGKKALQQRIKQEITNLVEHHCR